MKPGEERSGQLAVDISSQVDFMRAFTYPHDNTPDSCIAGLTGIGLESVSYGTHSMRRTKAIQIYRKIGNLRAIQLLLGHTKLRPLFDILGLRSTTL